MSHGRTVASQQVVTETAVVNAFQSNAEEGLVFVSLHNRQTHDESNALLTPDEAVELAVKLLTEAAFARSYAEVKCVHAYLSAGDVCFICGQEV